MKSISQSLQVLPLERWLVVDVQVLNVQLNVAYWQRLLIDFKAKAWRRS